MTLPDLMAARKAIAGHVSWSAPEQGTGYCWFDAPLDIGGVIQEGLILHGGCVARQPDRHVSFEIRAKVNYRHKRVPLSRIDWRSLDGGHTNRPCAANPYGGKRVSDSHYHSFDVNWVPVNNRVRADLSQAVELEPVPQSFESLRDFCGREFNIINIDVVSRPPWEYDLLTDGY